MEAVSDVLSRQPALPFEDQIAYLSLFTEENILGYHMVNFLLMFSVGYSILAVMQPSARVTDLAPATGQHSELIAPVLGVNIWSLGKVGFQGHLSLSARRCRPVASTRILRVRL